MKSDFTNIYSFKQGIRKDPNIMKMKATKSKLMPNMTMHQKTMDMQHKLTISQMAYAIQSGPCKPLNKQGNVR